MTLSANPDLYARTAPNREAFLFGELPDLKDQH